MKIDILGIGVHPDDIELSCSGTLLKHIALGKTVGICDLTQGELGTRGDAKTRLIEAKTAADKMGASFRINLGMEDGFFQNDKKNILQLIQIIRWSKPEIVLANALVDRHPDHGRAAMLVAEACFLSGLVKIETEYLEIKNQLPWRPKHVFHYNQDRNISADFVVDISPFIEQKLELIACFSSQFFNPKSSEPETPISTKGFIDHIKAKNMWYARDINVEYAEAFCVEKNIGIKNLFDLE
ncbi:MAG: bacillithiol biosynthesis deacetylase BshB1 [Saprospiraceae bacterium]